MAEWIEYPAIWLSPWCAKCERSSPTSEFGGRQWCESPQDPCDECGKGWSRYGLLEAGREREPDEE